MSTLLSRLRGYTQLGNSPDPYLPSPSLTKDHPRLAYGLPGKRLARFLAGGSILFVLGYFTLGYQDTPLGPGDASVYSHWCTVPDASAETARLSGTPGFEFLENVWYHNGTFYGYSTHPEMLPTQSETLTAHKFIVENGPAPRRRPQVCFSGTTLFINEGADNQWSGLYHYYHFTAEAMLGGLASIASWAASVDWPRPAPLPGADQIVIPWDKRWHDRHGLNEMVVHGIWDERVVDTDEWAKLADKWLYFERIAIVDRYAAHRHSPSVQKWNKMALDIFAAARPPHFFQPTRKALMQHYSISHQGAGAPQRMVYIDRQTGDRRLPDTDHESLLAGVAELADREGWEFAYLEVHAMTPPEQVAAVAHASVMFGVHGNGLTHELWLPEDATLIELWPPSSFLRDYQAVAEVLGHDYIAIHNDTIFTPEQQMSHFNREGDELHNGSLVPLDVPFFMSILEKVVRDKTATPKVTS